MADSHHVERQQPTDPAGPLIGLASYDGRDPEGTFRAIEPVRLPRNLPRRRSWPWPVLVLGVWFANLVALAVAGLIVTNVGADDPFAYVLWATVYAVVNASMGPVAGLTHGPLARVASLVAVPFAVNVVLVWLMTVVVPPLHTTEALSIAKTAAIMWLVNLPPRLLIWRLWLRWRSS
jgi:hypothetical protein